MRSPDLVRLLAASAATAALLTACGGGSGASTGGGNKKGPGDELTAGQLSTALLAVSQLPSGWSATKNEDDDDDEDTDFGDSRCGQELSKLAAAKGEVSAAAEVKRTFSRGKDSYITLEHSVKTYADGQAMGTQFDRVRAALRGCKTVTFSADGMPATVTLSTVEIPLHGDNTFTVRLTGKVAAFPFDFMLGAYRVGHNTTSISYGGLGEGNTDTFRSAMEAGWKNLQGAYKVDPAAPVASADPTTTLSTGGPGTYIGTSDDGVVVTVDLPVKPGKDSLADRTRNYLRALGPSYANSTLALVSVTNNSNDSINVSGLTVVTSDGSQLELDDLVTLLNKTDETNPDAYSRTGGELNEEASDRQVSDLKPGAKRSFIAALNKTFSIRDVYVSVNGEDLQLSHKP